jgi:hypothetical protein
MVQQVKQGAYYDFKKKVALNLLHWQHQASEKLFSLKYAQEPRQVLEVHIAWGLYRPCREFQARIRPSATAADLKADKSPCRIQVHVARFQVPCCGEVHEWSSSHP